MVTRVKRVAGGEIGRRAPAEASWEFCPRAISGGIDKGNGFLRAPGVCWWREQSGGGCGGFGINVAVTAAMVAGEEEDDHLWYFCCYGRFSEGGRGVVVD